MTADLFYDASGLLGMLLFLFVYFLLQSGKLTANDVRYSLGNLIGALLILISLWHDWNLPAFLLEVAWVAISLYGIVRHYTRKGSTK